MDLEKIYHDGDGNKRNIHQMVRCEPVWASEMIQRGEKIEARYKE